MANGKLIRPVRALDDKHMLADLGAYAEKKLAKVVPLTSSPPAASAPPPTPPESASAPRSHPW